MAQVMHSLDWELKARHDRELNEHRREMRERERQERKDAVIRLRTAAQAAAEELRQKRESLPTLDTTQLVTGDIELDMLVRKYQKAIDELETAIYAAGEDA